MSLPFTQMPAQPQREIGLAPYDRWLTPEGTVVALFHRTAEGFVLRFPGRADFALTRDDLEVTCVPVPGVSSQLIFDLYHNQVLPLIRNRRGALVLHASAVAGPGGVLGFVGRSGHGKSTLAASLALAGHPFLTDDGLVLERDGPGYVATPERAYLRVWSDSDVALFGPSASRRDDPVEKTLVNAGPVLPHQEKPAPLHLLYLLGQGVSNEPTIEPLNPARALSALINHAFILDVEDRPRLHAHFERLAGVAETVRCFSLDFPRRYGDLPGVVDAILAHATLGAKA